MLASGHTLRGYILDNSIQVLLRACVFASGRDTVTYTPQQLKGFELADRRYRSFPSVSGKPSFLLAINEGPLSLYSNEKAFYVQPTGTDTLMALIKTVRKEVNGQLTDVLWFRNQLSFLFQDCPSAVNLVPRLEYSTRSLSWAVQQYNSCKGQVDSYTVKVGKPLVRFGPNNQTQRYTPAIAQCDL